MRRKPCQRLLGRFGDLLGKIIGVGVTMDSVDSRHQVFGKLGLLGCFHELVQGVDQLRRARKSLLDEAQIVAQILAGSVDFVGDSRRQLADGLQPLGTGQFALHPFPLVNFRLELLVDPADGIVALLHAQGRAHAGREDLLSVGFGNVVISAGIETSDYVIIVSPGSYQDHRNAASLRVRFQPPANLDSIHPGHHHVEQYRVGPLGYRQLKRLPAVAGRQDLMPVCLEGPCRNFDELGNVINNQYFAHAGTSSASTA